MQKWKYLLVRVEAKDFKTDPKLLILNSKEETTFDKVGEEGWELVTLTGWGGLAIFKRPIEE